MSRTSLIALAVSVLTIPLIHAFTFSTTTPTQCGQWTVSWDGGTAPYQLILIPTITVDSGRIQNITIPSTASGSYTFELSEPEGLEFIATMYDSTGLGSGGATSVLTVGSSDNDDCLVNDLNYDFFFSTNPTSNPSQCSSMSITWDSSATRPINLYGLIPSGSAFSLPVSQSANTLTYDFTVDIASGSEFLLFMSDAGQYQTGGSTGLITVGSGNTSCMSSNSPSSATTSSSSTTASTSASTSASSASNIASSASASSSSSASAIAGVGGSSSGGNVNSSSSKSTSHTGAIVSGAVGGVAFLVLLALLLLCCIRRRSRSNSEDPDTGVRSYGLAANPEKSKRKRGPMDLLGARGRVASDETMGGSLVGGRASEVGGHNYEPVPFRYPSPPPATGSNRNTTGMALAAGVGAGALSEKAGSPSTRNRPSFESNYTGPVSSANVTPPSGQSSTPPVSFLAAVSSPGRHSSIRKTPSMQQMPGSPGLGNGQGDALLGGRGSGEGGRPLPDVPRNEQTRFVQHEDSGHVVDLPPRYDQLRARNPDPAL